MKHWERELMRLVERQKLRPRNASINTFMLVNELILLEDDQARISVGGSAQSTFTRQFKRAYPKARVTSIAPRSSQAADAVIKLDGHTLQFEIKARLNPDKTNVVYNKTIRRGDANPVFDSFAESFSDGKFHSFSDLVDSYRDVNKGNNYGFPGDKGTPSSGKLPSEFKSEDPAFLKKLRAEVVKTLRENGDNYFALYDFSKGYTSIYHTGLGENILGAAPYPKLSWVIIQTYGGGYKGAMQLGAKAIISASSKTIILR